MALKVPNEHRVRTGPLASEDSIGNNGAFVFTKAGLTFFCVASDQMGWEHVSVTINNRNRTPTWEQMCMIKELFWKDPDDCVIQYHPAVSEYVNNHPYCLHLWRPISDEIPRPPSFMVGIR